jgi:hypothetical protein
MTKDASTWTLLHVELLTKEMPYLPQDTSILIGPLLNGATYRLRSVNAGNYNFTHGRGYNDLIRLGDHRYKDIKIKGDPFIDSVVVNY